MHTKALVYTLAAAGCVLSSLPSSDAFWLIPGSSRRSDGIVDTGRSIVGDAREKVGNLVPGAEESPLADLLRALEEVTTDVGATASLAKSALLRGMYLRQNDNEYLLAMDVPGLHTNELVVTADRGTLKIKGEHKCKNIAGTEKPDPLCIERYYDAAFTFPSDADEEHAQAHLDAGVAYVKVPKLKGEKRGIGRVLKLTEDAAEWVYEESGAKKVIDKTKEAYEAVKEGVVKGSTQATETIKNAAAGATDVVKNAANSANQAANEAANQAAEAANAAKETVKNTAAQATDRVKGVKETPVVEDNRGFVERVKESIKERVVGRGSAEGQVPVERKDEL
ncbi:uncharacterized protein SPPG_00492 [Spizellomyces punctatus DAOM BR117]|uniref:SHSP domain-containing protein n=1 Tax=Spizellomyces punctatus (strain DAOM BR117) TaxID=645134 RepID=A0A0L0HUJ4_SPIPD|nr:uncharacterized protein SPPG_00492 [Spizellomyces punctatus DAOM BR117]KND04788.1 hypothetical protein SPPG_00492 [Spizellomyces punctatus DAOM BR117]|eukprot:XP_016612827.1 hypothetical protein SPPG_00492 [Spizellomyces punctatus DAOM BR117]